MGIRVVLNWDNKDEEYHLVSNLKKSGKEVIQYSLNDFNPVHFRSLVGKLGLFYKYFKGAFKSAKYSKKEDILIGTNFHVGALISIICLVLRKERKVLALNLILDEKPWLIGKIRSFILLLAFKNEDFFCTVNDKKLITLYSKYFFSVPPENKFFVLRDHYINPEKFEESKEDQNFIFTGGENSRDWKTLFEAARRLPNTNFVCIARERLFPDISVPDNVTLLFDIRYEDFISYLKKSRIVALPLDTKGPAGLLVIFDAAFLGKPVITTKTIITENYIQDGHNGILIEPRDSDTLTRRIKLLMRDREKRQEFPQKLKRKLEREYSASEYASKINSIIKTLNR